MRCQLRCQLKQTLRHSFSTDSQHAQGLKALHSAQRALIDNVPGFWPRSRLRLRLFITGQKRPFKWDDILALGSWVVMGHSLFFLIGTTTGVSLFIALVNSLSFQGLIYHLIQKRTYCKNYF